MAFVVSKEELFEELGQIIEIMNGERFGMNPLLPPLKVVKKNQGDAAVRTILKHYNKTTLYELNKDQMQESIDTLHIMTIKGDV